MEFRAGSIVDSVTVRVSARPGLVQYEPQDVRRYRSHLALLYADKLPVAGNGDSFTLLTLDLLDIDQSLVKHAVRDIERRNRRAAGRIQRLLGKEDRKDIQESKDRDGEPYRKHDDICENG